MQLPDAFFRGELGDAAAAARRVRRRRLLPPARRRARAAELRAPRRRRRSRPRASASSAGATSPSTTATSATTARAVAPTIRQLVVGAADELGRDQDAFERKLYVIRRVAELAAGADLVFPSFSSRTLVYKGMLTAPQVPRLLPRPARRARRRAALALVHSRFSTNTFPSWELAHPYRMIAHNGEINTLRGNVNWMRARESQLASELFGDDLHEGACRSSARAAPTRRRSTTCSSCSCSPAARCRTR